MEHVDVLIVGAGLSGIGAAWHLQHRCPAKSFAIFEGRDAIGGTWDLFRYPGIRSDSDMFTLGYKFKPWRGAKAIADGETIRDYIVETARENGIDRHIHFGHRVLRLDWSSADARWTITAKRGEETVEVSAKFVIMGSGYYRYDAAYTPDFPGLERFSGQVVHPQFWPETLDLAGKRVVVIGSGATAMTLVPAIAGQAAHVTMLQRSPTYVASLPSRDALADRLRAILPARLAYGLVRTRNVMLSMAMFHMMRRNPEPAKKKLIGMVSDALGADYDVETHFTPRYYPWDQRLCAIPDSDLFDAINAGSASVVTDTIEAITETGITLASGGNLDADIIVTATGLQMQMFGGAELYIDGARLDPSKTMAYKGMMLGDVPNLVVVIGYNNASWTLKADLTCEQACRIINHMDRHQVAIVMPRLDPAAMTGDHFFGLSSNYIARASTMLPKQGTGHPWKTHHNYARDFAAMKFGKLDDGVLEFGNPQLRAVA